MTNWAIPLRPLVVVLLSACGTAKPTDPPLPVPDDWETGCERLATHLAPCPLAQHDGGRPLSAVCLNLLSEKVWTEGTVECMATVATCGEVDRCR